MTAQKAFYVVTFVILGLFSSVHGVKPNKNDGESYEEEDLGLHFGLGGKWPWDWGSRIGDHWGNGQGTDDDDFGLGFDLGDVEPIGSNGKPSTGGGASGDIGPGTGTGSGANRCLSDCPRCGSGSFHQPLYNQPMYCRPIYCPNGGDCGGFGLHLDFGWPSLFERSRPHHAPSETRNGHNSNQN